MIDETGELMAQASEQVPAGLSPYESVVRLRQWIIDANSYSRRRKLRFRLFSSTNKIVALFYPARPRSSWVCKISTFGRDSASRSSR